jgi:hypothetical protein
VRKRTYTFAPLTLHTLQRVHRARNERVRGFLQRWRCGPRADGHKVGPTSRPRSSAAFSRPFNKPSPPSPPGPPFLRTRPHMKAAFRYIANIRGLVGLFQNPKRRMKQEPETEYLPSASQTPTNIQKSLICAEISRWASAFLKQALVRRNLAEVDLKDPSRRPRSRSWVWSRS